MTSNVIPFIQEAVVAGCGKCHQEDFHIVVLNGKTIAICQNCESPVVPLSCSCLDEPEESFNPV